MAILPPNTNDAPLYNEDEIIANFALLIRNLERSKTNKNLMSVIAKLEDRIRANDRYRLKMFLVNTATGTMINSDEAPNISFRVETINNIFDSIHDQITEHGIDNPEELFFEAGKRSGQDFARHILPYFENDIGVTDETEQIREWCLFDSSVGWGNFSYDAENGRIEILNNFEAKANPKTGCFPKDCGFLKGYVFGVLSILTKNKVHAIKCDDSCPKKNECESCCVLRIER